MQTETSQEITGNFKPIPGTRGAYTLTIYSENFPRGGRHLLVRVGKQSVRAISPFIGGGGFTARVKKTPNEGDRVYLQYAGSGEVATSVVFKSERIA